MEMKKIKEITQELWEKLILLLTSLISLLQIRYKKDSDEYNRNVSAVRQQQLNTCVYSIMRECAIDLYEALGSHSYPNLQRIVNPQSVRNYDYKIINGFIVYQYSLAKQSPERLPTVILENMQANMNRDIASTSHDILSRMGYNMMPNSYPFLMNGMYIIAIADIGEDVLISVASYIQP